MMENKNVLITGVLGSGGSYCAEYLINNFPQINVHGFSRWHSVGGNENIKNVKDKITLHEVDLMDLSAIIRALQKIRPYRIMHLASTANVRICFDTPLAVFNNNALSTHNLFEAVKMVCPEAQIHLCSTSEVLGNPEEFPMTENHPMRPVNPYAASKMAQEALAYSYVQSAGLKIIISRAFAYINPRRRDLFASSFAYQIAEIEAGKREVLTHGNLESVRTLVDIRDMARAYWMMFDKCEVGTPYNLGGRTMMSVGHFLEILKSHAKVPIKCQLDEKLLRPKDVTRQVPDTSKFDNLTGFEPQYSIDESIEWLLNHCRKEINQ